MKANTVKVDRTRVKELAVRRLEALTAKRRLGQSKPRVRARPLGAAMQKRNDEVMRMLAKNESRLKKESPAKQIKTRIKQLCQTALYAKRRSLKPAFMSLNFHRRAWKGMTASEMPPRVREVGPALRSLDRAEALLTRLVWRWAEGQARKEAADALGTAGE